MITLRHDGVETLLTLEEFEARARRGELSPFAQVCIPALTGERFVQARELPLFVAIYDPRRVLFRRHFTLSRLPLVTGALMALCVGLYLIASSMGDGVVTREALLVLGAKARARIVEDGATWRIVAANLLHRDVVHLGFNLFALLNIGAVLEGVYRRGDYVLLLVVSGVATMTASTVMSGPVSVGASGIIFGCLGCAIVFGLRFSEVLPLRYRMYFGVVVVAYAAAMFYLGLQRAATDNWGHAGGLLAGVVMGGVLEPRLLRLKAPQEPLRALARPWLQSVGIVAVVVAAGPLLPKLLFDWEAYAFDAFGVVVERPTTWTRGPDPLGFVAFGNGVDALASLACARVEGGSRLDEAVQRFTDGELYALERGGHIAGLKLGAASPSTIGGGEVQVPATKLAFSFVASDGPFDASAYLFSRGELECAFVLADRSSAPATSLAILDEIRARLRIVETRAQRTARQHAATHQDVPRAFLELALAHQTAGDVAGAREAFAQARVLAAGDPSQLARVCFAEAKLELEQGGNLDRALTSARFAVAQSREGRQADPDAAVLLVDVLLAQQDAMSARAVLDATKLAFPTDPRLADREQRVARIEANAPDR